MVLQHIVVGPCLHAFHRGFLVHGSGDDDEWNERHMFICKLKGLHAVKCGKPIIGDDDMGHKFLKSREKIVTRFDPSRREIEPGFSDGVFQKIPIGWCIFIYQDTKFHHIGALLILEYIDTTACVPATGYALHVSLILPSHSSAAKNRMSHHPPVFLQPRPARHDE